jgi:putative AlgH/UPF0301 family transcriptional regulator
MGSRARANIGGDEQNIRLDLLKGYLEAAYNKAQLKQETIDENWLSHHASRAVSLLDGMYQN